MTSPSPWALTRARTAAAGLGLLTAALVPGLVQLPAFAGPTSTAASSSAAATVIDDLVITPGDADSELPHPFAARIEIAVTTR